MKTRTRSWTRKTSRWAATTLLGAAVPLLCLGPAEADSNANLVPKATYNYDNGFENDGYTIVQQNPHVYLVDFGIGNCDPMKLRNYAVNFFNYVGGTQWNQIAAISAFNGYSGWGNTGNGADVSHNATPLNVNLNPLQLAPWRDPVAPPPDDGSVAFRSGAADTAIRDSARRAAAHFGVQDDLNAIIVVLGAARRFPLYNSFHSRVEAGGFYQTPYAYIEYGTAVDPTDGQAHSLPANRDCSQKTNFAVSNNVSFHGQYAESLTHELAEVVIDPLPGTFYEGYRDLVTLPVGSNEIADKEQFGVDRGLTVKLANNVAAASVGGQEFTTYQMPGMWSNAYASRTPGPVYNRDPRANMFVAEHKWLFTVVQPNGRIKTSLNFGNWIDWGPLPAAQPPGSGDGLPPLPDFSTFSGFPAGVGHGKNVDLFVGTTGGTGLYHFSTTSDFPLPVSNITVEGWGPPPEANGRFFQNVSAVSYGPDEMDVFAVTTPSRTLWHRRKSLEGPQPGHWVDTGWISLGTAPDGIASGPGAVAYLAAGKPYYRVYYVNNSGALNYAAFNGWQMPSGAASVTWATPSALPGGAVLAPQNPSVADMTRFQFDVLALAGNSSRQVMHCKSDLYGTPNCEWEALGLPVTLASNPQITAAQIGGVGAYSGRTQALHILIADPTDGSIWQRDIEGNARFDTFSRDADVFIPWENPVRSVSNWYRSGPAPSATVTGGMSVVGY